MGKEAPKKSGAEGGRKPRKRPPRRRRSRVFSAVSWVVLAVLWVWALAWVLGEGSWHADLLANLAAQGLIVTVGAALVWAVTRRYALFGLAVLACGVHVWMLASGRAALMPRGFEPAGRVPGAVRMFHYNASHKRPPEEVLDVLRSAAPDVASIAEPSVPLQMLVMYGDALKEEYPYRLRRQYRERGENDRVGAGVVLSRWPLEPYATEDVVAAGIIEDVTAGVLTVPGRRWAGARTGGGGSSRSIRGRRGRRSGGRTETRWCMPRRRWRRRCSGRGWRWWCLRI